MRLFEQRLCTLYFELRTPAGRTRSARPGRPNRANGRPAGAPSSVTHLDCRATQFAGVWRD
eukprot:760641-Alexandrium_andersonii.AAC.1